MGSERREPKTKKAKEDPKMCELSTVLPALITQAINRVVAGKNFSFAITDRGVVYGFGCNNQGQLALGSHKDQVEPQMIQFFEGSRVNDIVAGGAHAHAVLMDNEVFSWGRNVEGQLGLSNLFAELACFAVPQQITEIMERRIRKICAGHNHSIALTGTLLACYCCS
jgi:alpha-tubulin suppressor-like RCC1 family protein